MPIPDGMPESKHLGDGLYIHFDGSNFRLIANYHDPVMLTMSVALSAENIDELAAYRDKVADFLRRKGELKSAGADWQNI